MIRTRTTEDPGLWRIVHDLAPDDAASPRGKLTLEVFEGPGVRARTIEIISDGAIRIDGKVIMSALTPRLRKKYGAGPRDVLMGDIQIVAQEVADASGVTVEEMRGPERVPRIVEARKVAMFLTERRLGITHDDVGKFFNRERSTVSIFVAEVARQTKEAEPVEAEAAPEPVARRIDPDED
jgi:hypothetical protein